MLRQLCEVLLGLLGEAGERGAGLLGLDRAGCPAVDEQEVVGLAGGQREFADRHAARGLAVEFVAMLQDPPGGFELPVDQIAGTSLGRAHGHVYSGFRA